MLSAVATKRTTAKSATSVSLHAFDLCHFFRDVLPFCLALASVIAASIVLLLEAQPVVFLFLVVCRRHILVLAIARSRGGRCPPRVLLLLLVQSQSTIEAPSSTSPTSCYCRYPKCNTYSSVELIRLACNTASSCFHSRRPPPSDLRSQ